MHIRKRLPKFLLDLEGRAVTRSPRYERVIKHQCLNTASLNPCRLPQRLRALQSADLLGNWRQHAAQGLDQTFDGFPPHYPAASQGCYLTPTGPRVAETTCDALPEVQRLQARQGSRKPLGQHLPAGCTLPVFRRLGERSKHTGQKGMPGK